MHQTNNITQKEIEKLSSAEARCLIAVITGNTEMIVEGKRHDSAKDSLIQKGYLRVNEHQIVELALSILITWKEATE